MVVVPTITLNDGNKMPAVGLGTYQAKDDDVETAVKTAIDVGYRHIDTAFYYKNESEVGKGIKAKIAEGVVKRSDIFLVTKLAPFYQEASKVENACRESLKNLGLDYIDLYLIHCPIGMDQSTGPDGKEVPVPNDVDYVDTWKEMEKLVKLGLVRSIGISNFNSQLKRVLDICTIKPVTNQVECHLEVNQKKLIEFCKNYEIVITAYSPLGQHKPEKKTPAFLYDEKVKTIADKYKKTIAQICLRYLIQIGTVPIPKSVTKSRIEENIKIFDFVLSNEDMKALDSFNTGKRVVDFAFTAGHKNHPFNIEY